MNNKKDVNNKYGMFKSIHNTDETRGSLATRGALATGCIMLYLLEIVFNNTYCDTDSVYLINKSEGKNE